VILLFEGPPFLFSGFNFVLLVPTGIHVQEISHTYHGKIEIGKSIIDGHDLIMKKARDITRL
jgi:hypothetical protein